MLVRARHGGTQVGLQIGTQIFVEGPNWDPISITRDPNVDPNVAPIVDPIDGPNCVFAYSFEQNCLLGTAAWVGMVGL